MDHSHWEEACMEQRVISSWVLEYSYQRQKDEWWLEQTLLLSLNACSDPFIAIAGWSLCITYWSQLYQERLPFCFECSNTFWWYQVPKMDLFLQGCNKEQFLMPTSQLLEHGLYLLQFLEPDSQACLLLYMLLHLVYLTFLTILNLRFEYILQQ